MIVLDITRVYRHDEDWQLRAELEDEHLVGVHGGGGPGRGCLEVVVELVVALIEIGNVHGAMGVVRHRLVVDVETGD